jgi:hypothetical protein
VIQVVLPTHLGRLLAGHRDGVASVNRQIEIEMQGPATFGALLDALEARYPALRGTLRDHLTKERRPFIRFFACGEDFSHHPPETPLPEAVAQGREPLRIVGAMAGG